jgi:hypothetical protein
MKVCCVHLYLYFYGSQNGLERGCEAFNSRPSGENGCFLFSGLITADGGFKNIFGGLIATSFPQSDFLGSVKSDTVSFLGKIEEAPLVRRRYWIGSISEGFRV